MYNTKSYTRTLSVCSESHIQVHDHNTDTTLTAISGDNKIIEFTSKNTEKNLGPLGLIEQTVTQVEHLSENLNEQSHKEDIAARILHY